MFPKKDESQTMVKAIMGGTFDPITRAHILCAKAFHEATGCPVTLIPSYSPWQKVGMNKVTPFEHRFEMCKLATQDEPGIDVSDIERKLPTPSYMMQTLRGFIPDLEKSKEQIFLFLGSDQILNLSTWKEVKALIKRVSFFSFPREKDIIPQSVKIEGNDMPLQIHPLNNLAAMIAKTTWPIPFEEIAAKKIRERVKLGQPIQDWVPNQDVADYIATQGLYR